MIGVSFTRTQGLTLSGAPFAGDFVEFYNAGRILNKYGSHRLYDFQLQDDLTHELLPHLSIPFVTPPYVAISNSLDRSARKEKSSRLARSQDSIPLVLRTRSGPGPLTNKY